MLCVLLYMLRVRALHRCSLTPNCLRLSPRHSRLTMQPTSAPGADASTGPPPPVESEAPCTQQSQTTHKRARRGGSGGGGDLVRLSREMSKVLRHAPPKGAMDAQGWVALHVLAAHLKSKPTLEQIRQVGHMDGMDVGHGCGIIMPCMCVYHTAMGTGLG